MPCMEHAESALEGACGPHCETFSEEAPLCLGGTGARRVLFRDLTDELKTGLALSSASLASSILLRLDQEACLADSSDLPESILLVRSSSEDLYVLGLEADERSKPVSSLTPTDSEMVEVINRAKARLKLDWSMEWEEPAPGRLDKWFLLGHKQPQFVSLPFLPELHNEMVKS